MYRINAVWANHIRIRKLNLINQSRLVIHINKALIIRLQEKKLNIANNLRDAEQSPQRLIVPNQQQPIKPYAQLDIRTYQLQQVDTSRQENSEKATARKEQASTIYKVKLCAVFLGGGSVGRSNSGKSSRVCSTLEVFFFIKFVYC